MKHIHLKSIFATFLLLVGVCQVSWGRVIYLDTSTAPSPYNSTSWWAHIWGGNDGGDKPLKAVEGKSNLYQVEIGTCINIIFIPNSGTGSNWTSQTADIEGIPSDKNCYQITGQNSGTWTTYGSSICNISDAPSEIIAGTHVMFYIESYGGNGVTIGTANKVCSAAQAIKVGKKDGQYNIGYVTIAKSDLTTNYYITDNPGGWEGISNEDIKTATGGEYFVGNASTSKMEAKTATTTINLNSKTLNISTTASSATGVYNSLPLYVLYYIDGTFARVTHNGEEADYCSIKASTSALSSTYDVSSLSAGTHTLLTILTDGNIYYIADTDKFTMGSVSPTYTVTFDANGHGTAPAAQQVENGKQATKPSDPSAEGYTFGGWYKEAACTNVYNFSTPVTTDITLYAKWTANAANTYTYYYYNRNGWATVQAHIWIEGGNDLTGGWDAGFMSPIGATNWYSITFTSDTKPTHAIFHSGDAKDGNNIPIDSDATKVYYRSDINDADKWWDGFVYKVDIRAGDGGTVIPSGTQALKGSTSVTATANEGYAFTGWTVSGGVTITDDKDAQTTLNATADGTLTASFAKIHEIVLHGNMQADGSVGTFGAVGQLVASEDNQTASLSVTLKENTTYEFKLTIDGNWKGSQSTMTRGNSTDWDLNEDYNAGLQTDIAGTYTFTWSYATSRLTVTYPGYSVEIKSADATKGTVDPAGVRGIAEGGSLTITATPQFGYKLGEWVCTDGITATIDAADPNRATVSATQDGTVTAQFVTDPDVENNPCMALWGTFGKTGGWEVRGLTRSADGKQATYTMTVTDTNPKEFGIRQLGNCDDLNSQVDWWYCSKPTTITRSHCTDLEFIKQNGSNGKNPTIQFDVTGDYVFTYTFSTRTLSVTFPPKETDPKKYILHGNFGNGWTDYDGTWSADLKTGEWTISVSKGAYMFGLKCASTNEWLNAPKGASTIQRENNRVVIGDQYSTDARENVTLNADEDGDYLFTFDYDKMTITVTYPGGSKEKYRLVYAETKADGTYEKYHPSTPYINATAENTGRKDTVSLHVRFDVPTYHRNALNQIDKIEEYHPNSNALYVYLQKWDGTQWATQETLSLKGSEHISQTNGVYNFVVVQDGEGNAHIDNKIEVYRGNYYIRTNVAPGGWNDYQNASNRITYSDYAAQHKHFDHYWCKWVAIDQEPSARDNAVNLKFTIANDYSNCVSDTCLNELDDRNFTVNGRLGHNANIRWMWHSKTNALDRAYIAGGSNCLFFVPKSETITCEGKTAPYAFDDRQNWTYKIDVKTAPGATFALTKRPYDGAGDNERYWVVGSEEEGIVLVNGLGRDTYTMRVVYDFKSDHLIYAWIPADIEKIDNNIVLDASVVCMRKDNGAATQIQITPAETTLSNVHEALGVLSLSKKEFYDKDEQANWNSWEREYYWISFPFNVNVSDIFSTFVYDRDYIIQEYDGASRAKNGCWSDSPSYWRTLSKTDKMEAGKGYVLYISHAAVTKNNVWAHNPTELNIYFPSTGVTEITGTIPSVEIPAHPCDIKRNNRDIYDSNWNLIGVPTWVNIEGMGDGPTPDQPENTNVSNIILNEGKTVGFYYHFNTGKETGKPGNTWTPQNVSDGISSIFKNMHSYLIQWAGTINWSNRSWDETPSEQALQARRAAKAQTEEYTLRLELGRDETALDQTFVRLQENGDVTTDYDMNYDMTKVLNAGTANIYSLIGENRIQAGANVLPLPAENTTVYVPVGVVADRDGMYRFSMPDGTEGMTVSLADHETGMTYNLALGDYEVALTKGTHEQRFVLEIQPKKGVTTGCNESTAEEGTLRKVLIDGNLYIQRGDALYDAAGRAL